MAAAQIVKKAAVIDKSYVLQQAQRMFEASASAAIGAPGEDGSEPAFDPKSANVASRFLDQIGRHVDVQAFKDTSDINISITVDGAISRLAQLDAPAIEGDYEVIEE